MKKIVLVLLSCIIAFNSCDMIDNFLEDIEDNEDINSGEGGIEKPEDSEETLETIEFTSAADIEKTINNMYSCLRDYLEIQAAVEKSIITGKDFKNMTPENKEVEQMWNFGYQTINHANICLRSLEISDVISEQEKEGYILHCRAIRGFVYKDMMAHWGGIPIMTENHTLQSRLPREEERVVVEYSLAELKYALHIYESSNCLQGTGYMSDNALRLAILEAAATIGTALIAYCDIVLDTAEDNIFTLHGTDGKADITVYTKRHAELLKSELMYGHHEEYKWEEPSLYGYWASLKRVGRFTETIQCPDHMQYLPIPMSEMCRNENIVQNAGYF